MLDNKGFDDWAFDYDEAVSMSDKRDAYPFAGYADMMKSIRKTVREKCRARVLDLGFGTGAFTSALYADGCEIWGQDFSEKMVEEAKEKMPNAHLVTGDFCGGLAPELAANRYDCIVATYSLHHFASDEEKIRFIRSLMPLLNDGGVFIMGDVAFETRAEYEFERRLAAEEWDDDECYSVYEELEPELPGTEFEKISHCGGVFRLTKEAYESGCQCRERTGLTERQIKRLFEKYLRLLRITPPWDVKLELVRDQGWRKTGDFRIDCDDRKAVLMLNVLEPKNSNMEEVIVHELMHIKLYPLDQVTESLILSAFPDEGTAQDFAYRQFFTALEQTVEELAKCFLKEYGEDREFSFGRCKSFKSFNELYDGLKSID